MKSFEAWSRNSVRLRVPGRENAYFMALLILLCVYMFFPNLNYTQGLRPFLVSLEKGFFFFQINVLFFMTMFIVGKVVAYKKRPVFLRRSYPAPNYDEAVRSLFLALSMRGYELRTHGSGLYEFVLTSEPDARDKVSLAFEGELAHVVYPSTLESALNQILLR